ncbi:hypothetical protein OG413_15625 [Streptomyces sp. NBC_01433]|nr:hypothetical protein [Streptomyces sp. NBC_01433]MCX4676714.1 hypothetical protein [Streptomyces sp. NBC_01433]
MALKQTISIDDLAKRNAASQQKRAAEKAGSGASGQQQTGR